LTVVAALLQEDSIMVVFYLLAGTFFVARIWSQHSLESIRYERSYPRRAFLGETIQVRLTLTNTRRLPTLWIQIHESLPLALATPHFYRHVLHLGSREKVSYEYPLLSLKRGYYPIGPLFLRTGYFLGLAHEVERQGQTDFITIFPKIVPISQIGIPTHTPFGGLKHHTPVFEDPSRVIGKREYQSGDSLRHIDWKASAAGRNLIVKKFEPSISLESCIFLDLNPVSYDRKARFDATELAIVVAASVASWVTSRKQAVGMCTNGTDPLHQDQVPALIPPRKGRNHLMHILDVLARIQSGEEQTIHHQLNVDAHLLPWGTTVILVTGTLDDSELDPLSQILRRGLDAVVILVGPTANLEESRRRAAHYGIEVYQVRYESDLDQWQ
jgi:uncharacterized protein (DUF58 family)